ncbi:uncharacterized protein I206_101347 [Kwoniella pini CBS 10737]|uniref:Uncharacterized protein n=1 Tax=Kwoniella pini CBS 10737 TaxID=1296096 RepID=A0A1B9HWY3_9TREE|nr:uncharacterized protein I206_06685 [Kwoniella pini CBS 10737]OCF47778.1 hypothetical protein I206_06685 [Kwoniella pini CBS 10737]
MSPISTTTTPTNQSDTQSSIPQSVAPMWTVVTKREKEQITATVPDTVQLTKITIRQMNEPDHRGRRISLMASDPKTDKRYIWSGYKKDLREFDDRDNTTGAIFRRAVSLIKDNDGTKQEYTTTEGEKGKYRKEKDDGTGEDLYVYSFKAPTDGDNIREEEEITVLSESLMKERAKFDVTASEVWARFQGYDLGGLKAAGTFKRSGHEYSWRTTSVKDDKGSFTYHVNFLCPGETNKKAWLTMGSIEANSKNHLKDGIDWKGLKNSILQQTSETTRTPTDSTVV